MLKIWHLLWAMVITVVPSYLDTPSKPIYLLSFRWSHSKAHVSKTKSPACGATERKMDHGSSNFISCSVHSWAHTEGVIRRNCLVPKDVLLSLGPSCLSYPHVVRCKFPHLTIMIWAGLFWVSFLSYFLYNMKLVNTSLCSLLRTWGVKSFALSYQSHFSQCFYLQSPSERIGINSWTLLVRTEIFR